MNFKISMDAGRDTDVPVRWTPITPFYEFRRLRAAGPALSASIAGLVVLAIHYVAAGPRMFSDWSWFLSAVVFIAVMAVQYATKQVHDLWREIRVHAGRRAAKQYYKVMKETLSSRALMKWGVSFGIANVAVGWFFGPPHGGAALASVLFGYAVAGFVCGIAVRGIFGVCKATDVIAADMRPSLDFTAPDKCGGIAYVGDALIVFSSATLIVGVAISVYILQTPWQGRPNVWMRSLLYGWVALPYVLAALVFVRPALPLHRALLLYKREQERKIYNEMVRIRKAAMDSEGEVSRQKAYIDLLQYNVSLSTQLYGMKTWPVDLDAKVKLLAVVLANVTTSATAVSKYLSGNAGGSA